MSVLSCRDIAYLSDEVGCSVRYCARRGRSWEQRRWRRQERTRVGLRRRIAMCRVLCKMYVCVCYSACCVIYIGTWERERERERYRYICKCTALRNRYLTQLSIFFTLSHQSFPCTARRSHRPRKMSRFGHVPGAVSVNRVPCHQANAVVSSL